MMEEGREIMMGEGNRVASVTLFTFTVGPGPYAHFYSGAGPPCSGLAWAEIG